MDNLCYFCLVLLCFHARLFVNALWSPAGKGLTSWLSFEISNCDASIGILVEVWCLVVSISDLCPLSYFEVSTFRKSLPKQLRHLVSFAGTWLLVQRKSHIKLW